MEPNLLVGRGLLILEASRSHSVGLQWTSNQPDLTTHSSHKRQTSMAPSGIRTRNPSKRASGDARAPGSSFGRLSCVVLYVASEAELFINTGLIVHWFTAVGLNWHNVYYVVCPPFEMSVGLKYEDDFCHGRQRKKNWISAADINLENGVYFASSDFYIRCLRQMLITKRHLLSEMAATVWISACDINAGNAICILICNILATRTPLELLWHTHASHQHYCEL